MYVANGIKVGFTGKERDAETGLDYFLAGYYSSPQGRFTSADPVFISKQRVVDPQQWNLYSYARNNPLRFLDRTGRVLELTGDEERERALADIQRGAALATGAPASDSFLVVEGRVIASDIKYTPIGRVTGSSYTGSATVEVIESLNVVGLPNPNHGQKISIAIEERSKKPTWEKPSRQNFIFLLQPIKGRSDFRAVYVVAVDPELIRIARERRYNSLQELQVLFIGHKGERTTELHRQRTGRGNRPRLLRSQVLLRGAGQVHQPGLVREAGAGALR